MASQSTSVAGGGSTMPRVQTEARGSPLAEEIAPEDAVVEVRPLCGQRSLCGRLLIAARALACG